MNVSIVFPGQGSQYVGMPDKFLNEKIVQETYAEASEVLGFNLLSLCQEGPLEKLTLTEFTQPAIVTQSIAMFRLLNNFLKENNISVQNVLGHSVGEYPALVAAGVLNFKDAVKSVNLRGKYMQEEAPVGIGAMYAVVRLTEDVVIKACEEASTEDEIVTPANFNDPTQIVISGHKSACERAVEWLKENVEDRHMCIPLKVSAPFHSPLMDKAALKLEEHLNTITFNNSKIPYIANIDAKRYDIGTSGSTIKENLVKQVAGSVLWTQSIQKNFNDGDIIIECGPGKVLTGLNKKINKNLRLFNLDVEDAFTSLSEFLK